jgi:hypothetical protein
MSTPTLTRVATLEGNRNYHRRISRVCLAAAAVAMGLAAYGAMEQSTIDAAVGVGTAAFAGGIALFREMRASTYEAELLTYGRLPQPVRVVGGQE